MRYARFLRRAVQAHVSTQEVVTTYGKPGSRENTGVFRRAFRYRYLVCCWLILAALWESLDHGGVPVKL